MTSCFYLRIWNTLKLTLFLFLSPGCQRCSEPKLWLASSSGSYLLGIILPLTFFPCSASTFHLVLFYSTVPYGHLVALNHFWNYYIHQVLLSYNFILISQYPEISVSPLCKSIYIGLRSQQNIHIHNTVIFTMLKIQRGHYWFVSGLIIKKTY